MLILAVGIPGRRSLSHPCLFIFISHALVRETFCMLSEKWMGRGMLILARGGGGWRGGSPAPALCHTLFFILISHTLVRETFWMLSKFQLIELGTIRWLKHYHTLSWHLWTHPRCMIIGSSRRKFFDSLLSSTYLPLCNAQLIFQSAMETLIRICRHPPRPDAVCRYQNCSNKAQIYLTDPGRCSLKFGYVHYLLFLSQKKYRLIPFCCSFFYRRPAV